LPPNGVGTRESPERNDRFHRQENSVGAPLEGANCLPSRGAGGSHRAHGTIAKKLERSGIIEGYTAIINPDASDTDHGAGPIVTDARVASAE
jgi:hypothetical protein